MVASEIRRLLVLQDQFSEPQHDDIPHYRKLHLDQLAQFQILPKELLSNN